MYHLTVTGETVACSLAASYCHEVISSCVGSVHFRSQTNLILKETIEKVEGVEGSFLIRVSCRKFPALAVNPPTGHPHDNKSVNAESRHGALLNRVLPELDSLLGDHSWYILTIHFCDTVMKRE